MALFALSGYDDAETSISLKKGRQRMSLDGTSNTSGASGSAVGSGASGMSGTSGVASGAATTTKRREWWGWFGVAAWMFFMMYGHDTFLFPELTYADRGTSYPTLFMVLFAFSVAAFGWRFGKDPDRLARVASYTAPAATVITAVFALLPTPLGSVLYAASPILMAPAITRRLYGVLHTAGPGKRLARYASGITVCVVAYTAWIILELPREFAFLIPALITIPSWLGIRRTVTLPAPLPRIGTLRLSKGLLLGLAGAFILLFWLDVMSASIHTHIIAVGDETSEIIYTLLGFILPPVGFLLYGIIGDKGYERAGFICGMMLFLTGIILALLPSDTLESLLIPLAFADGLGGSYAEFLILTLPIYFLINTKRPVFVASLGLALDVFTAAWLWEISVWLPEAFMELDIPLLASAAISAIGFVVLVYFLFERHRERTVSAALYALLYGKEGAEDVTGSVAAESSPKGLLQARAGVLTAPNVPSSSTEPAGAAMLEAGFTQLERDIALLLMDGITQRDIARKLHMTAADVSTQLNAIKKKVGGKNALDPALAAVVKTYRLTRREIDMLRCLQRGMTNVEIAAELFLSEETVKIHVRNLMRKLPIESRSEVTAWTESFTTTPE
jgi:DNA-binding CsgD family transcriptional regulator